MATRFRRDERGQTLVEFALIIPIVLLMMLGVFDLGRVVFVNNSLSDGARHGARHAATDPRAADYCTEVGQAVRTAILGQPLAAASVAYQVVGFNGADSGAPHVLCQLGGSGDLVNGPGKATLPAAILTRPGHDRITVTLQASVPLATPLVAVATGRPTFDIDAVSTMVVTFAP